VFGDTLDKPRCRAAPRLGLLDALDFRSIYFLINSGLVPPNTTQIDPATPAHTRTQIALGITTPKMSRARPVGFHG
jgi:hypothetical protein